MSDYTVAITGATGKTGHNVVSSALGRGWQVRALSRRPAARGQWIPFDWDNQRSWSLGFPGQRRGLYPHPVQSSRRCGNDA